MLVSTPFDIPLSPWIHILSYLFFSPHTFRRRGPKWKLQVGGYRDLQEMNQSAGTAILAHDRRPTCSIDSHVHQNNEIGVYSRR